MNLTRVREAEAAFLERFPLGFDDPGLAPIRKRHNVDKLAAFAKENFTELSFAQPQTFCDLLVTVVGRSSMVSRFEKAPFRDAVNSMSSRAKQQLTDSFRQRLVGRNKQQGFEAIVEILAALKLARWSVVSAVPFYFAPKREAFVKPTTAKKIIDRLEVHDLTYRPRPDWAFYSGYRRLIHNVRRELDPSLAANSAAVTGFLMVSL